MAVGSHNCFGDAFSCLWSCTTRRATTVSSASKIVNQRSVLILQCRLRVNRGVGQMPSLQARGVRRSACVSRASWRLHQRRWNNCICHCVRTFGEDRNPAMGRYRFGGVLDTLIFGMGSRTNAQHLPHNICYLNETSPKACAWAMSIADEINEFLD